MERSTRRVAPMPRSSSSVTRATTRAAAAGAVARAAGRPELQGSAAVVVVAAPRVQRREQHHDLLGPLGVFEAQLEIEVRPVGGLGGEQVVPLAAEGIHGAESYRSAK